MKSRVKNDPLFFSHLICGVLCLALLQGCSSSSSSGGSGGSGSGGTTTTTFTAGAKMTEDTADEACMQLTDANLWTTYANYVSNAGTQASLDDVLANLNESAVTLTSSTRPNLTGYLGGVAWSSGDMATTYWVPQGLTMGTSGSKTYALVSWHYNSASGSASPNGSRISVVDVTTPSSVSYRNVILVEPTGTGTYQAVKIHVGGLAVYGNYLYVADTSNGMRVFDLSNFRDVDGDSTLCRQSDGVTGIFGQVGTEWCADGYGYMLPQVNKYTMPSTLSCTLKPIFSWLGKDTRTTNKIISGEYCNNADSNCGDVTSGLNGRLFQWQVGSDNKLVTSSSTATPLKVYYFNERNVQGVAPVMLSGAATDSYWLSSSANYGKIYQVSPSATAKTWSYSAQVPYIPEGIFATESSGQFWLMNEGTAGASSASGGRVLLYADQSALN